MFPGVYEGYKEGDDPIKSDIGLSDEDNAKLRHVAMSLRDRAISHLEDDDYYMAGLYRKFHQAIEDVIGHPKYYI